MRVSSAADLHMHSRASDGSDFPEELPALAASLGMRVFSLTDHDTVSGSALLLQSRIRKAADGYAGKADQGKTLSEGRYQPGKAVQLKVPAVPGDREDRTIWFLPGVELSCRAGDILCHLVGYCYDPDDERNYSESNDRERNHNYGKYRKSQGSDGHDLPPLCGNTSL